MGDTASVDLTEYTRRLLDRRESADAPLRIVQVGHPALRRPARDARGALEPEILAELVDAMTLTMHEAPGVGLAAPQIGLPLRLFVAQDRFASEDGDEEDDLLERRPLPLRAMLDPSYEAIGTERVLAWEGCLSMDGFSSIVPRARRIAFRGTELRADGSLEEVQEEHLGWTARILQHETDHLAGTICHDLCIPRSIVANRHAPRYAYLPDAVTELGLEGEIATLGSGQIRLP